MARPKYNIGDSFLIERSVKHDGCDFKGEFSYYVLTVLAESDSQGYCYKYGLGRVFPQAYLSASVTLWLYENSLSKAKQIEGYFGKA